MTKEKKKLLEDIAARVESARLEIGRIAREEAERWTGRDPESIRHMETHVAMTIAVEKLGNAESLIDRALNIENSLEGTI